MTKQDIQDYKDKRNLEKGFNAYWNKGFDEAIALLNSDEQAINYTPCCMELKADNKKLSFKDWKYSKGMRYLSEHTYKDNDGDLYDSDELEKMYQNYLRL